MSTNEDQSEPGHQTTRDQFDKLAALVRRALRYWWVAASITLVGGTLAVLFALLRAPTYESETVLLYREMIPTEVLQGRAVAAHTRNVSSQYREMTMARKQLRTLVEEFGLFPELVEERGREAAVEELRQYVDFRDRGAGTFQIAYRDSDPTRAKEVTARLTDLLIAEDRRIRLEQASVTKDFLEEEKTRASDELRKRQRTLSQFLAKHPEFAQETLMAQTPGASIRAQQKSAGGEESRDPSDWSPQLGALLRQRDRMKERLAGPDQPTSAPKSPERIAAEARVRAARRDVESAESKLGDLTARGLTGRHPDVMTAEQRIADAKKRLRRAEASMPALNDVVAAAGPVDRDALRKRLDKLESQIASERSRIRKQNDKAREESSQPGTEEDNWVVVLETEWANLTRELEEARDRVESLEGKVFAAEIAASSEMAEHGGQITIIDPAYAPQRPIGKGKRIIVMAGLVLFGTLGLALAFGLALIDDRIYGRQDLEQLGIAPVMTVVPPGPSRWRRRRPPSAPPPSTEGD